MSESSIFQTMDPKTYLLSGRLLVKLDEGVLQRIPTSPIPHYLTRQDLAESREDQLEIFVLRNRVQFAHEQNVLGRSDRGKGDITDHLQRQSGRGGSGESALRFDLFFRHGFQRVFLV